MATAPVPITPETSPTPTDVSVRTLAATTTPTTTDQTKRQTLGPAARQQAKASEKAARQEAKADEKTARREEHAAKKAP